MEDNQENPIRVGTRKSQLALIQTNHVIDILSKHFPENKFEVVSMSTTGDKILDTALSKIGEKSLFTKELEYALEDKRVDLVVHSLKDLPTTLPKGMVIGAILKRDSPYDAVVLHPSVKEKDLASLPEKSVIGTSSLRRAAQLKRKYPHLVFKDVRGNLNTRLRKLDDGDTYQALILAEAGLKRMGWPDRISQVLGPSECMYAISQGALAVECRSDDEDTLELLSKLHDYDTVVTCIGERAFLKELEGGCSVPVAVYTTFKDNELCLKGGVYSIDGTECVEDTMTVSLAEKQDEEPTPKKFRCAFAGPEQHSCVVAQHFSQDILEKAETLGQELAKKLLEQGAGVILDKAKAQTAAAIGKTNTQTSSGDSQTESDKSDSTVKAGSS